MDKSGFKVNDKPGRDEERPRKKMLSTKGRREQRLRRQLEEELEESGYGDIRWCLR